MILVTLTNGSGKVRDVPPEVIERLSLDCSFEVKGAEKSQLYKKKRWDGRRKLFTKTPSGGKFPIGLWHLVRSILIDEKVEYQIRDNRDMPERSIEVELVDEIDGQPLVTRPYQREAAIAAMAAGQSVVRVATGGGKTYIAALLVAQLKCRTLFMVHTKDLLYQALRELSSFLDGVKIGQIGDGIVDVQPITIATMQTVSKYLGVEIVKDEYDDEESFVDKTDVQAHAIDIGNAISSADMVIWDEVHRVACDTAYGVMEKVNAYYRVGLSASPWRDDGADLMIEAAMGATCYSISASSLIDLGYLVQPIIRRIRVDSRVDWFEDTRSYDTIYREDIVENESRNNLILHFASAFMELGVPSLILVQQIKHGNTLKRLISDEYHPIDFISGRDLTQKRLDTIQGMRDGEILATIASTIADEGLDIKRLAGLILAGGGKSSTRALQRVGRTLRTFPGKTHAVIIDLADESKYLRAHAHRRKQIYQTEPRFVILET